MRTKMWLKIHFLLLFVGLAFTESGCTAKLTVKSDPTEADVYVRTFGGEERKLIGKTPLTLSHVALQDQTKVDPSAGEFFELIIEKKDFQTERLLVPASRLGHIETTILSKLKPGYNEGRVAQALLQHLFNAQKLGNQKEFERAQVELDKALAMDANFVRAMSLRGSIYFIQGRYEESLQWFEKALETDPKFEDAIKMIAQVKKAMGMDSGRLPSGTGP